MRIWTWLEINVTLKKLHSRRQSLMPIIQTLLKIWTMLSKIYLGLYLNQCFKVKWIIILAMNPMIKVSNKQKTEEMVTQRKHLRHHMVKWRLNHLEIVMDRLNQYWYLNVKKMFLQLKKRCSQCMPEECRKEIFLKLLKTFMVFLYHMKWYLTLLMQYCLN